MDKQPNYYAIIPAEIRYDNRLSSSEKLFYAELTALSNKTGECWASRKYFSTLYSVAESTVTSWTNNLCKHGYIDVDYQYDGKQIIKRTIKITNSCGLHFFEGGGQNIDQGGQKTRGGVVRKPEGGWSENRTDNTTSNNTTSNNKERVGTSKSKSDFPSNCEFLEEARELSMLLLEKICEWDPTHHYHQKQKPPKRWILDIERAMRIDGRSKEQIEWIINFLFTSNHSIAQFWSGNVQSGSTLRSKFDKIKNQIKNSKEHVKYQKIRSTVDSLNFG